MNSYIEIKAKTLDEAITKAILELQTTSEHMEYEVIDQGSSGFFGIGAKPVRIKARAKEIFDPELSDEMPKKEKKNRKGEKKAEKKSFEKEQRELSSGQEKKESPKQEKKEQKDTFKQEKKEQKDSSKQEKKEQKDSSKQEKKEHKDSSRQEKKQKGANQPKNREEAATLSLDEEPQALAKPETPVKPIDVTPFFPKAEEFLQGIFKAMDMEVETDIRAGEEVNTIEIELKGDDMGVLIGKRGQTLDALQYLTSIIVNTEHSEYVRVKVDTENYRKRRKDTLENLANNLASKVKRTGKAVTLEPMNAYERRIIHSVLQQNKYVNTHSEGDEPFRKVVVTPDKNFKPRQNNRRRPYRGGRRNDRRAQKSAEQQGGEE